MRKIVFQSLLVSALASSAQLVEAQSNITVTVESPMESTTTIGKNDCTANTEYQIIWSASVGFEFGAVEESYDYELYVSDSTSPAEDDRLIDSDLVSGDSTGTFRLGPNQPASSRSTFTLSARTILGTDEACELSDQSRYVVIRVKRANSTSTDDRNDAAVTYSFDADGPSAPTITKIEPGNNNLKISFTKSNDTELARYEVIYLQSSGLDPDVPQLVQRGCTNYVATSSVAANAKLSLHFKEEVTDDEFQTVLNYLSKYDSEDNQLAGVGYISQSANSNAEIVITDGLQNGVCTLIVMRAVSTTDIAGGLSNVATAFPVSVLTYADYHAQLGGEEEGGYCFIATAAHGSYAHPTVRILRLFRDYFLKQTTVGTAIVAAYYQWSPSIALEIAKSPMAKSILQALLVPIAFLGIFLLMLPFAGLGVLLWLLRRQWVPKRRLVIPGLICLVLLLGSLGARDAHAHNVIESGGMKWALSFEGGPYLPAQYTDKAFNDIFGYQEENTEYNLGLDFHLSDAFGDTGVGFGFGLIQFVGKGRVESTESIGGQSFEVASDTTVFNILPLRFELFYRLTYFDDNFAIPLTPYVRGGLGYYLWWVTDGVGDVDLAYLNNASEPSRAAGGKYGFIGSLGIALELNTLEHAAASKLRASTGIVSSSLYFEYNMSSVDSFGAAGFDFSNTNTDSSFNTWRAGVYLEF